MRNQPSGVLIVKRQNPTRDALCGNGAVAPTAFQSLHVRSNSSFNGLRARRLNEKATCIVGNFLLFCDAKTASFCLFAQNLVLSATPCVRSANHKSASAAVNNYFAELQPEQKFTAPRELFFPPQFAGA
jgi:hypothetical protein